MTLPLVTIGIPTFNRAAFVGRAVESVLRQTYAGPIGCVVVDDGSTDDTSSILSRFRSTAERKLDVYTNEANRGIAYTKNRALIQGNGELRGILDSDDWYEPTFVERCVAELQAAPALGMVYTDNLGTDGGGKRREPMPAADWSLEALLRCQIRGDCYLARWSVLEATQLHDELFKLEVDYDLFYQLAGTTVIRRIPEALHTVTQHGGRTSQDRQAAAYWHATGLGKYGHPISWAEQRAVGHDDWLSAISDGYAYGQSIAYRRQLRRLLRVDDNTPERWQRTWSERTRLDARLLADVLAWVPERCTVADLGCGDGVLLEALVAAHPEVRGVGFDFALPEKVPTDRLQWQQWDLRWDAPPGVGKFDVVMSTEVIEHLQDPIRVLQMARQMLAPRGCLLLSTPLADDIKDTYHLWALRPADIAALAEQAGGGVIRHMQKTGEWGARAVLYMIEWPNR